MNLSLTLNTIVIAGMCRLLTSACLQRDLGRVLVDLAHLGPAIGSRGLNTTLFHDAHGRKFDAHFDVLNAAALESRLRLLCSSQ